MKQRKANRLKNHIWLIVIAVIASISVAVSAYYIKHFGEAKNILSPAESINPTVEENFENGEKTDVSINVGETGYPVYVRATIVFTFKKRIDNPVKEGEQVDGVYYLRPQQGELVSEGDPDIIGDEVYTGDYIMELNLLKDGSTTGWVKGDDDYYYYVGADGKLQAVESGKNTDNLINYLKQVNKINVPDGYFFDVEIITQTIQAIGTTDNAPEKPAWEDAGWKPAGTVKP